MRVNQGLQHPAHPSSPTSPSASLAAVNATASAASQQPPALLADADDGLSEATAPAAAAAAATAAARLPSPCPPSPVRRGLSPRASASAPPPPPSPRTAVRQAREEASEHLNAGRPQAALGVLQTVEDLVESQQNYAFQARLGVAHLGVVDALNERGELGTFALRPDAGGDWCAPQLEAERLTAYLGTLGAYGRFLTCLAQPETHATLVEQNGAAEAEQCISGIRAGLIHVHLEARKFINDVAQINSNANSAPFVAEQLAKGSLSEDHPLVRSFREVQAHPFYVPIKAAGAPVNAAAEATQRPPTLVWRDFVTATTQRHGIKELSDFNLADVLAALQL